MGDSLHSRGKFSSCKTGRPPSLESRQGLSVIEALIALSIMTVAGLVFSSMIVSYQNQLSLAQSKMGFLNLTEEIRRQIQNNSTCTLGVKGQVVDLSGNPGGFLIRLDGREVRSGNNLTSTDYVVVDKFEFKKTRDVNPNLVQGQLWLSVLGGSGNKMPFKATQVTTTLFLKFDGSHVVTDCYSVEPTAAPSNIQDNPSTLTLQPCPDTPSMAEGGPTDSEARQLIARACNAYDYGKGGRQDIAPDSGGTTLTAGSSGNSDYSNRTRGNSSILYTSFGPFADKDTCLKAPAYPAGMQVRTPSFHANGTSWTTRSCAGGTWSHIESETPSAPSNASSVF